jgi:hypothetical protein
VAYLKEAEQELWAWASSAETKSEYSQEVRTALLKSHYRLDADGHPELAARSAAVAERLGVAAPVTLYQATGALGLNATLCHLPGEAHIVFSGPILATLKEREVEAVLAHELSHYLLWEMEDGEFLTADRLLLAAANDPRASGAHVQTARRFRLYTEVFADRGSLAGCGDLEVTVAALVKTETGLPEVSAASYLRQADEIFAQGAAKTNGVDHPETFIRARALRLWRDEDESLAAWLGQTIEGPLALDELDLPGQRRMAELTRRFLGELLRPRWFQTAATLAHAQAFFPGFTPATHADDGLVEALRSDDAALREYLCFLLLDFAAADPALEETPLAAALVWSKQLDLCERFEKLVLKELGLGKRQLTKLKKEAPALLEKAATEA